MESERNGIPILGAAITLATLFLAGCGAEAERYRIGGTVSGFSGAGLVLANNGADDLAIAADGPFTFSRGVADQANYAVTVQTHSIGQSCSVANGSGTVNAADVANITVTCSAAAPLALLSTSPAHAATNVARTIAPTLTFSAPLGDTSPITSVTLLGPAGNLAVTPVTTGPVLTVTPGRKLLPLSSYTLTADTGVRGRNGEQLPAAVGLSFTTANGAWQPRELRDANPPVRGGSATIALNAAGNGMAMWMQEYDVWSSYYTAGAGWGQPQRVERDTAASHHIATDDDGNVMAVSEISEAANCGSESECERYTIRVRRYTPQGGWGSARNIASHVSGNSMDPRLAMNPDGTAILVWTEAGSNSRDVWAKRYTREGGWDESVRIESSPGYAWQAGVAIDVDGNAIATWQAVAGTRTSLWSNRYTIGSGWGTPQLLENDDDAVAQFAQIVMDAGGNALVVWSRVTALDHELWWNRYSRDMGWSPALPVEPGRTDEGIPLQLGVDAGGNVLAVWEEFDASNGGGYRASVWSRRYVADSGWSAAEEIDINGYRAGSPYLAVDPAGNALVVWTQTDDGNRFDVASNRYAPGTGWGVPVLLENDDAGSALATGIAVDGSGDAIAVWEQTGNPIRFRVYSARFE